MKSKAWTEKVMQGVFFIAAGVQGSSSEGYLEEAQRSAYCSRLAVDL